MTSSPHRSSTFDTTLDSKDGEVSDDISEDSAEAGGLSRIYIDAARFGEVLAEEGSPNATPRSLNGPDTVKGFADLVGRDLDAPEQAETERFAKLSVNSWPSGEGTLDGPITLEPDSYEDSADDGALYKCPDGGVSRKIMEWAENHSQRAEEKATVFPEIPSSDRALVVDSNDDDDDDDEIKLSPEEVITLLVNEFGPLNTSGEDDERLLIDGDGAFFNEIAIVGKFHLTTHRLAFHASLLATRPDILPEQQILRRGPVIIHRPGLRRKLKLWMELSHDMLTTFPSSKEEDRIRPIRSVLLSMIKSVVPEDPENPRVIRIVYDNSAGPIRGFVEFDTEESAREWRRELQGALFLYRHRRATYLSRPTEDESNGVRISVPLSQIKSFSTRRFLDTFTVLKVDLLDMDASFNPVDGVEGYASRPPSPPNQTDKGTSSLEIALIQTDAVWSRFGAIIAEAKARQERAQEPVFSRTFVDFGSLSFTEQPADPTVVQDEKEVAIKHALSLGDEPEIWCTRARISRSICSGGYFVVTPRFVAFWAKGLKMSSDEKLRLPISMVLRIKQYRRKLPRAFGLTLELEGHPDFSFDFGSEALAEEVQRRITAAADAARSRVSGAPTPMSPGSTASSSTREESLSPAAATALDAFSPLSKIIKRTRTAPKKFSSEEMGKLPKVINIPSNTLRGIESKHFVCLTIGSRGDVQPYIALALGLQKEGHVVTIVTHEEYKEWVEGWGIRHRTAGGDPGALMKLSVEHKMFSPQFFKESLGNFRTWLDELLVDAWEQCRDAEVLLESPSAMAGVHIAEALGIPYFRTFTMPWTKTAEFPHSFLGPPVESPSFNISSYILFDNVFWAATSGQINRWRRNTLHIGSTDMGHLAQSKIPFIYNFSTAVVPKPLDWGDAIVVSGYWFLENPDHGWTAPDSLLQWMARARADRKPIVYIGFGSITVPNPPAMTRSIIKAVLKSDVRALISKGWSARMSTAHEPEVVLPPECYSVDKIPHDWLFPKIDAAVHHGGAGTTGASLRAGIPTIIKPWFGDQFFWASRVQKLGAGLKLSGLRSADLAHALTKATSDRIIKERAAAVGQKIRLEDGVANAIQAIYLYLHRAGQNRTELH